LRVDSFANVNHLKTRELWGYFHPMDYFLSSDWALGLPLVAAIGAGNYMKRSFSQRAFHMTGT